MHTRWSFALIWVTSLVAAQTIQSPFTLTSNAFKNNTTIPTKYTCDGKNVSPALQWQNVPHGTKSFALIVDDPDAPKKVWAHWILFNIPSNVTKLSEGVSKGNLISGVTDFYYMQNGVWQYGGPCPPSGTHHYYFTIYALDTMLDLTNKATKKDLQNAMKGHILGQAQLIGLYQRKK